VGGRGTSRGGGSSRSLRAELAQKAVDSETFADFIRSDGTVRALKTMGYGRAEAEQFYKDAKYKNSAKYAPISLDAAVAEVRKGIRPSALSGWFRSADSDYKPEIEAAIIGNPALRNAGLNIAHRNYMNVTGRNISFDDFINGTFTVYRGGKTSYTKNDVFISYSFSKEVAQSFGGKVQSIRIKPKNTLGSYQTTGEAEILVRRK
jgi:hypothetical protein